MRFDLTALRPILDTAQVVCGADAHTLDSLSIMAKYDSMARDSNSQVHKEAEYQGKAFKISADSVLALFRPINYSIRSRHPGIFSEFALGATSLMLGRNGVKASPRDYYSATDILYYRGYDNVRVREEMPETVQMLADASKASNQKRP